MQYPLLSLGFFLIILSIIGVTPASSKQRIQCDQNHEEVFYLENSSNEENSSLSICPYSDTQQDALIEELGWIKQHGKSGLWIRKAYEVSLRIDENIIHDTILTVCTPQGKIICRSSLLSENIDFINTDSLGTFSVIVPAEKSDHPLAKRVLVISPLSYFSHQLSIPLTTQLLPRIRFLKETTAGDAIILFR